MTWSLSKQGNHLRMLRTACNLSAEDLRAKTLTVRIEFAKLTGGRGSISTVFSHYAPCPPGFTAERERIGANPLDRAKYILEKRNALTAG